LTDKTKTEFPVIELMTLVRQKEGHPVGSFWKLAQLDYFLKRMLIKQKK